MFFFPFISLVSLSQGTGEARDYYVPNPSCKEFHKFEWIGQLMGAALRGKDFLVGAATPPPSSSDVCITLTGERLTALIWFCACLSDRAGLGSAWAGVEAADWRDSELDERLPGCRLCTGEDILQAFISVL